MELVAGMRESIEPGRLAEAWGEWLSDWPPNHWATFTFRQLDRGPAGVDPNFARAAFERFVNDLRRRAGQQIEWFWAGSSINLLRKGN